MKTIYWTIRDPQGIHARPAGLLVKTVSDMTSRVSLAKGDKTADPRRIFSVMALAAKSGEELTFTLSGDEEESEAARLQAFLAEHF